MIQFLEVVPGRATLATGPRPDLPEGWVRVSVRACGLCGTDLHLFNGMDLPRGATYPVRPGHEVAGEVLDSTNIDFGPGDEVVLHPLLPCGDCAACLGGNENRCRTARALGIDVAGGLADEVIWPASRLVHCKGLDPVLAAILCDAVASAHHALLRAKLPPGGALTVIGAGGVGANILQLARILDPAAVLTAVVRSQATAERIEQLGLGIEVVAGLEGSGRRVLSERGPQDAVIEFGPGAAIASEVFPMLGRGGRLIFGSITDEALSLPTTITALVTRELEIIGTYASTIVDLRLVVALALEGRLDLASSVSHRFPLDQSPSALEFLRDRGRGMARIAVIP